MKRKISIALSFLTFLFIGGCYPGGPDYIEEMDVVLAKHNADYNFSAKGTYAIPDKIVKVTGKLVEGGTPEFVPDITGKPILARIESNMTAYGWQKVDISENPDLLLAPASWETTTVTYWYDYWYWYWGGYYPPWGWGGGYYPPVYWTSYTTGSLIMALIDKNEVGANGNPVTQWSGIISGIMTNSYNASRVNSAIDKAFAISPYLNTK